MSLNGGLRNGSQGGGGESENFSIKNEGKNLQNIYNLNFFKIKI